jgi:hypothetical protein
MRRLVDIDEVIRVAKNTFPEEDVRKIAWVLCHTPTVYNLEKVVEELERKKRTSVECLGERNGTGFNKVMDLAIDIVKRGGVE